MESVLQMIREKVPDFFLIVKRIIQITQPYSPIKIYYLCFNTHQEFINSTFVAVLYFTKLQLFLGNIGNIEVVDDQTRRYTSYTIYLYL